MPRSNSSTPLLISSHPHYTTKAESSFGLLHIMRDRNIGNKIISFFEDDARNPDNLQDYRSLKTTCRDLQGAFTFIPYKYKWAAQVFNVVSFLGTSECGYGVNSCCGCGPNSCCCLPARTYCYDWTGYVTGQSRYITDMGYREITPDSLVTGWLENWLNTGKMIFCCGFNTPHTPSKEYDLGACVAVMQANVCFGVSRLVTKTLGTVGCGLGFFAGSIKDKCSTIRPYEGRGLIATTPAEARTLATENNIAPPPRQTMF